LAQTIKHKSIEETILEEQKQNEEEEDMNAVKALPPPPPQGFTDIEEVKEDETKEKQKQ
jgi:hypothetical protein